MIDTGVPVQFDKPGLLHFKIVKNKGLSFFKDRLFLIRVVNGIQHGRFDLSCYGIDIILAICVNAIINRKFSFADLFGFITNFYFEKSF